MSSTFNGLDPKGMDSVLVRGKKFFIINKPLPATSLILKLPAMLRLIMAKLTAGFVKTKSFNDVFIAIATLLCKSRQAQRFIDSAVPGSVNIRQKIPIV